MECFKMSLKKGSSSEEERALRELVARIDAAWNRRDAKAFSDLFEEQADFRFHTGLTLHGKSEIENYYLGHFPKIREGEKHRSTIRQIRFIRPDVSILDSEVELFRLSENRGEKETRLKLMSTTVTSKEKGHWFIAVVNLTVPQT
jgi:uncharacterized protein (TIGR02246 family)